MKKILTLLYCLFILNSLIGQDLSGDWNTGADNVSVNLFTRFTIDKGNNNQYKGEVYEKRTSNNGTYAFNAKFNPETSVFIINALDKISGTERHRPSKYTLTYIRVGGYEYLKGDAVSLLKNGNDYTPIGIPTKVLFKRIVGTDEVKVVVGFDSSEGLFDFDGDDRDLFAKNQEDVKLVNSTQILSDATVRSKVENSMNDLSADKAFVSYDYFKGNLSSDKPDTALAKDNPINEESKDQIDINKDSTNPNSVAQTDIDNVKTNKIGYINEVPDTYDKRETIQVGPKNPYSNKKYDDYNPYEDYEVKGVKFNPYKKTKIDGIYNTGNTKVVKIKLYNLNGIGSSNPITIIHNREIIATDILVGGKGYELDLILYSNKINSITIAENQEGNAPSTRRISIKTDSKTYFKNIYFENDTNITIELVR